MRTSALPILYIVLGAPFLHQVSKWICRGHRISKVASDWWFPPDSTEIPTFEGPKRGTGGIPDLDSPKRISVFPFGVP